MSDRWTASLDQAYRNGWADGERWVMDRLWEYVLLRFWLGRWLWRLHGKLRWWMRGRPEPTPVSYVPTGEDNDV